MYRVIYLVFLFSVFLNRGCTVELGKIKRRSKRSLHEFKSLVQMTTRRTAWDFVNYGNFCGYGGSGFPRDHIDRCCYEHDMCYNYLQRSACSYRMGKNFVYFSRYRWLPTRRGIVCLDRDECMHLKCVCDVIAAECFKHHSHTYNPSHKSLFGKLISFVAGIFG